MSVKILSIKLGHVFEGKHTMNKQNKSHHLEPKSTQQSRILIRTKNRENPPLTFGPRRLHYQYSAVLPSIHLTLVSILQGIAFGVLLLGIPLSNPEQVSWNILLIHEYFYLPYLISSLVILLIWKEFAQACLFSNWPLSALQTGLTYLIAVPEILAFRAISIPTGKDDPTITSTMLGGWLISIAFIGIIGGCIRINNLKLQDLKDYESEEVGEKSLKLEIFEGSLYIGLGILVTFISLAYFYISSLNNIKNISQITLIMSWGIIALLFIFVSTVFGLDANARKGFLRRLATDSDLIVSETEVLRYSLDAVEDNLDLETVLQEVKVLSTLVQLLTEEAKSEKTLTQTLINEARESRALIQILMQQIAVLQTSTQIPAKQSKTGVLGYFRDLPIIVWLKKRSKGDERAVY